MSDSAASQPNCTCARCRMDFCLARPWVECTQQIHRKALILIYLSRRNWQMRRKFLEDFLSCNFVLSIKGCFLYEKGIAHWLRRIYWIPCHATAFAIGP